MVGEDYDPLTLHSFCLENDYAALDNRDGRHMEIQGGEPTSRPRANND